MEDPNDCRRLLFRRSDEKEPMLARLQHLGRERIQQCSHRPDRLGAGANSRDRRRAAAARHGDGSDPAPGRNG
jgi:hypothetical protein